MTNVSISLIEQAINAWRDRRPTSAMTGAKVCDEVRALAELYGVMIFERATAIDYSALTERQKQALALGSGGRV